MFQLSPDQLTPSPGVLPNSAVLFEEQGTGSLTSMSTDMGIIRDDFTAIAKLGRSGCGLWACGWSHTISLLSVVYVQFCEVMEKLEKLDCGLNQVIW